ncbi:MAG: type 1 glutamine amidotransferase [Woeseiaceae bacterium]
MRKMNVHLGILDAVPPEFCPDGEKSDPQKFVDLFTRISAPMTFSIYDATQGHFPETLEDCDAYLITGSPCSVYDTYPWIKDMENFIHHVYAASKPLIGICFGHQLIAQSLGGKVQLADGGWLLGLHPIKVDTEKSWMTEGASTHPLYFINQDQVVRLPPDVELLASSDECPNAMYQIEGKLLSLQAHPEQPLESMLTFTQILIDKYHISQEIADAACGTMADGKPDADRFAGWISEFLQSSLR